MRFALIACLLAIALAQPVVAQDEQPTPEKPAAPVAAQTPPAQLPPEIVELLAPVDDRGPFSSVDTPAYYAILDYARKVPVSDQRRAAAEYERKVEAAFKAEPKNRRYKYSLFAQMWNNPSDHRGQLVTLRGHVRQRASFEAEENDQGIKTLYQFMLFTEDSEGNPYTVVTTEVPPNLPPIGGKQPLDYVTVTGYFLRCWTYPADTEHGIWRSPCVLARTIEWKPVPVPQAARWPLIVAIGTGVAVISIAAYLWQRRVDRLASAKRQARVKAAFDPSQELRDL